MYAFPRHFFARQLVAQLVCIAIFCSAIVVGNVARACDICAWQACILGRAGADDADPVVGENVAYFGTPRRGWDQTAKGEPVTLTYSYNNMFDGGLLDSQGTPVPAGQIRTAIEEALAVWAEVAPLHFIEVPDQGGPVPTSNYPDGQFGQIRFHHRYINGPDPPTGNPTTKAQAYYPTSSGNLGGDVFFDHSDPWELIGTTREPDILGAAIHEIGHALGLTHSSIEGVNMYWIFKRHAGPGTGELLPDDIAAIQSVYGAGAGSVTPLWAQVPEPPAFLLAMAAALVMLRLLQVKPVCEKNADRTNCQSPPVTCDEAPQQDARPCSRPPNCNLPPTTRPKTCCSIIGDTTASSRCSAKPSTQCSKSATRSSSSPRAEENRSASKRLH